MIVTLTGTVTEKLADLVVLDIGGVGYGVLVCTEDYGYLQHGSEAKLYIHEHIRETSHDLYGFQKLDTKQLFEQLLDVNGVGPKMALALLSIGSADEVRSAIANGDVKYIQQASGVGKRVAERVVIELKDKVGLSSQADLSVLFVGEATVQGDEAMQALVVLGYSPADAATALKNVATDVPLEERIKQALKGSVR